MNDNLNSIDLFLMVFSYFCLLVQLNLMRTFEYVVSSVLSVSCKSVIGNTPFNIASQNIVMVLIVVVVV